MSRFRVHKYLPFAFIYFFVNTLEVLPLGLTLTGILSPLFYVWLLIKHRRRVLLTFVAVLSPWIIVHVVQGVDLRAYLISLALAISVYVTGYAVWVAIQEAGNLGFLFSAVIAINFVVCIIGIAVRFTPAAHAMWSEDAITVGASEMMRFRGFTYEPSHYSILLAPLFLYTFWDALRLPTLRRLGWLLLTIIPLVLSFSFGVLAALIIAIAANYATSLKNIRKYKFIGFALGMIAIALYLAPNDNIVKLRLVNVLTGNDTSGQARTIGSYIFSYEIAATKNAWFGVGFGQIKLVGEDIIAWAGGRLPCAIAETLAQFGLTGVVARLFLCIFLFFRTGVRHNRFRISLFVFLFVYQFTGSFLTNLAEYVGWVLAFSPIFPEFNLEADFIQPFPAASRAQTIKA